MDSEKKSLKGKTGQIIKDITVMDVQHGEFGTDIRIKEEDGAEYWTSLDESIIIN